MANEQRAAEAGLSKLAHAIRRSTALHVAMNITPPESSVEDMLKTADRLARWIGGQALEGEASAEGATTLGQPWPPTE